MSWLLSGTVSTEDAVSRAGGMERPWPLAVPLAGLFRHSAWDGLLAGLSLLHGAILFLEPSFPVVALLLWWNANTIAHHFIHAPFFRSDRANRVCSVWLSVVLGFPQSLWRARHLAHHGGRAVGWRGALPLEIAAVAAGWNVIAMASGEFFLTAWLPGVALGLAVCGVHGYYEHAKGTTSHYGKWYNWLFFNDGYHVEHHLEPERHWKGLPLVRESETAGSRWPPVLRWIDELGLEGLERLVLRSEWLQRYLLATHERAFRQFLPSIAGVRKILIVGGGMFPRTALLLEKLVPAAEIVIVDASLRNLDLARPWLAGRVRFIHARFDVARAEQLVGNADLVVIPLSFDGERRRVYETPPAPWVLVHDWIWSRRSGARVSWWLLKKIVCVRRRGR